MRLFDIAGLFRNLGLWSVALGWLASPLNAQVQADPQAPAYVGSQACAGCHQDAYEAWQGSHHAKAWQLPAPELLGNGLLDGAFEGEVFVHDGMRAEFRRDGDDLTVAVTEKDGVFTEYTVHSVAGIAPLQQLLLETSRGRIQSFDVAWDVASRQWYHLYPDQDLPPVDGYHWTGPYKNWNTRCAECHATGFEKNFDFQRRRYESTQVEIGVGCEACHGPGAAHLEKVENAEVPAYGVALTDWGFTADMSDPVAAMQQCAGCHARREAFGAGNPLPGTDFEDAYNLSLLRPGLYHADGQILDEVYVYGSFLQSKMHSKGVTCANCHTPHAAETVAEGNAVCAQCHSPAGNPDFPSLPLADFDTPEHTHHEAGSDGAQCVSCHMVERTYMGIDGRRDHSFRVPRPDMASVTGAPDACTDCHADKNPDWAAQTIATWFPQGKWQRPHYGATLAAGQRNPQAAAPRLLALAQQDDQPALVRATALWLLGPGATSLELEDLAEFLTHEDPMMRAGAVQAMRQRAPVGIASYLITALKDDVAMVRLAAARAILSQSPARMAASLKPHLRRAYAELGTVAQNQMDFPETHLQLGGYAMVAGNLRAAIPALTEAVRLDPQNTQAWASLVRMTAQAEGAAAANRVLRKALRFNPNDPTLRQMAQ